MSWPSPCACRAFMTNPQSSPDTSIHMYRTAHCGSCHSSHLPLNIHRSNWEWWRWRVGSLASGGGPSRTLVPFGVYRLASLLSWPTAASRTLDLGVRLPCRPCLSGWKDPTKPVELSAEPPTADQGEDSIPDPDFRATDGKTSFTDLDEMTSVNVRFLTPTFVASSTRRCQTSKAVLIESSTKPSGSGSGCDCPCSGSIGSASPSEASGIGGRSPLSSIITSSSSKTPSFGIHLEKHDRPLRVSPSTAEVDRFWSQGHPLRISPSTAEVGPCPHLEHQDDQSGAYHHLSLGTCSRPP